MIDFTDSSTITAAKLLAIVLTIQGVISWLYWTDLNNAKARIAAFERRPAAVCQCGPQGKPEAPAATPEPKDEIKPEVAPEQPKAQQEKEKKSKRRFKTTEETE